MNKNKLMGLVILKNFNDITAIKSAKTKFNKIIKNSAYIIQENFFIAIQSNLNPRFSK